MNEFLTSFSSEQSAWWAVFILGVIMGASLVLSLLWGAVSWLGSIISVILNKTLQNPKDVLP